MAAASSALSNSATQSATTASKIIAAAAVPVHTPPKTQRGLNKPKCIQCGNVARSRCPYQSCKSCCSKAQNPCHIHVLKANATFPDKTSTSSSPLFDQHSTEVSTSGTSLRVASLRQLSNNFTQFNNLQSPLRTRKPLTRKDAAAINEWRFSKLKECRDRNIEVENEALDRYKQKISLLEEVFLAKSIQEGSIEFESSLSNPNSTFSEDNPEMMISGLKSRLRLNPVRIENSSKRIKQIVDQGLKNLQKCESNGGLNDQDEYDKRPKMASLRADRVSALNNLIDKLNKVRNEEDLKSCLEIKSQLFNQHTKSSPTETEDVEVSEEQNAKYDSVPTKELSYSLPKLFSTTEIDEECLKSIDTHFSSLEQIEDL